MAIQQGTNLGFLYGLQSKVNSLMTNKTGIKTGAFYLTSDTNRLYFGKSESELVALNEGVTTVDKISSLPQTGQITGSFYYATAENVLCVYNGTQWVQINPDTTLQKDSQNTKVTSSTKDGKTVINITSKVTDTAPQPNNSIGIFELKADNGNISLSTEERTETDSDGNEYKVTTVLMSTVDTKYDLDASESGLTIYKTGNTGTTYSSNGATINLKGTDNSEDNVGIVLSELGDISVKQTTDGKKVIDLNLPSLVRTNLALNTEGKVQATSELYSNGGTDTKTAKDITPIVKLDSSIAEASISADGEYKFAKDEKVTEDGRIAVALPVYTTKEVDTKIANALSAADALDYQGTVDNATFDDKITSSGHPGYVYKVTEKISKNVQGTGQSVTANIGDLLICTLDTSTNTIVWETVPSGDDQLIQILTTGNKFTVQDSLANESLGSVNVTAKSGGHIKVTPVISGSNNKNIEYQIEQDTTGYKAQSISGSDNVTLEAANGETNPTQASFTAVTGITVDDYGNVTGTKSGTFTVVDSHSNLTNVVNSVTKTNKKVTIETVVQEDDNSIGVNDSFSISSDSLDLQLVGDGSIKKEFSINLVWGTF